jgi:hypothetical protein
MSMPYMTDKKSMMMLKGRMFYFTSAATFRQLLGVLIKGDKGRKG